LLLVLYVSCKGSTSKNLSFSSIDTTTIKVGKALKLIKENASNPNFVILDVRKSDDYIKEHIPQAINIDFKSTNFSARLDSLNISKTYVVICYAGVRSKSTMQQMAKLNFKKVYSIKGGMMKWKSKGLPVTK